jgi:Tfp pilus assembly protein PilX
MAGTARTGSARAVAIWSPVEAVRAAAASPPSNPALRSITTVDGVAEPGMTRPIAFPASCADATANQPSTPSAIRSISQRQTELAISNTSTSAANGQSRCSSERQEDKTETRLGKSKYRPRRRLQAEQSA